jgi:hypothetical protein
MRKIAKSTRVAAVAALAIGVASQTAVDVARRTERSVTAAAAQTAFLRPNLAVARMRNIRQLRTLTAAQRSRIDAKLGLHRDALREAATAGDPTGEVRLLLADVEHVLTPVQRREVGGASSLD